jgi:hypothetical protein
MREKPRQLFVSRLFFIFYESYEARGTFLVSTQDVVGKAH